MRFHHLLLIFLFISLEFHHQRECWAQEAGKNDLGNEQGKVSSEQVQDPGKAKPIQADDPGIMTKDLGKTTPDPKETTKGKKLKPFFKMSLPTTTTTTTSTTSTTTTTASTFPPETKPTDPPTTPGTTVGPAKKGLAGDMLIVVIVVCIVVLIIISSIVSLVFYFVYRYNRRSKNQASEMSQNSAQRVVRRQELEAAAQNVPPPGYSPDPSQFKQMGALKITQTPINMSQEPEEPAVPANENLPLVWDDDQNKVYDIGTEVEEVYDLDGKKVAVPQQSDSQAPSAPTPLWSNLSSKSSSQRPSDKNGGGRNLKAIRED